MKKLLTILITLTGFLAYAQSSKVIRLDNKAKEAIAKISPDVLNAALRVEHTLDVNNKNVTDINDPYINTISQTIQSQSFSSKKLQKVKELICIECYQEEWNGQLQKKNEYVLEESRIQDSIINSKIKMAQKNDVKEAKANKKSNSNKITDKPYDKLKRSLYAFSTDPHFTVFRNMDYNFTGPNIQGYLQQNMRLALKQDGIMSETQIVENYVPKVTKDNEFLKVKYNVIYNENVVGCYPSDYVLIIKDVEITGSYDLIVKLFLNYWPGNVKLEEYKDGLIATKQVLGDYVTVSGHSGKLKINIVKGNMDVDYTSTYGINKPKS